MNPRELASAHAREAQVRLQMAFDDNSLLPQLFGEGDKHLERIERALGVALASRGNRVAISGQASRADLARAALTALYDRLKRGLEVDAPAVDAATDNTIAAVRASVGAALDDSDEDSSLDEMSFLDEDAADRNTAVYFGTGVLGSREGLQSWAPGAAPILVPPSADSGIKLSALEGADYSAEEGGESVAGKDDASRMESPAQRLGLDGEPRVHAEKCLSEAIYFEARGEPLTGQEAVAQVVMNRVFSGYYPHDVCGVVFQNKNHHLACQFTFACEGKDLSRIDEPDMWEQAKEIAKKMLDGKIWLADIGHATHYHAYWVHPSWVHEMVRLYKLGVHTFYRPRAWGDDEPTWSPAAVKDETEADKPQAAATDAAAPAAMAATPSPEPAVKGPQAAASPADGKGVQTAKL